MPIHIRSYDKSGDMRGSADSGDYYISLPYERQDAIRFYFDAKNSSSETYNDKEYYHVTIKGTDWTNVSTNEKYSSIRAINPDAGISILDYNIYIYVKDVNDSYYLIDYDRYSRPLRDSNISIMSLDQMYKNGIDKDGYSDRNAYGYIYYTSEYDLYSIGSFKVQNYASASNIYISVCVEFTGTLYPTLYNSDAVTGTFRHEILSKKALNGFRTDYKMTTPNLTYPSFCNSSKAVIYAPEVINSTSVVLYRSIDNGTNWTKIYNKDNNTTNNVDESVRWSIKVYDSNYNSNYKMLTLNAIPPITLSYQDTDAINQSLTTTHGIKYKAVYTALGSNGTSNATTLEVAPSTEMQVMDLTLPGTMTFAEKADYFKSTGQTYSITKTTVADITRIKFRHLFKHTSLPNTTVPGSSTDLQDYPDRETNMGQWLTTPNGTYEYQIVPILDGSECYTSSIGQKYEKINFVKAGHKLEAIRPIEMGSNKPIKIKLLTTPSKTEFPSGASVKFYVANNGNDSNIAWEELPNSCIGTPSNPNVDQFQFSNTTKTADTWKVMIKIVADKNTATTDFKLNNFTVIINGGEKDTSVPGYKYIANTILTENATSVRIDIPQGYKKIRIEGYMTPTGETNTGYNITVNGITSYTDNKMRTVLLQGSSPWTNSANSTVFLNIPIGGGAYNHLTLDLFNDGIRWIGSLLSIGDKGLGASHNRIKLTDGLSYITLSCAASGYMAKNTEITIMGVD